ncbi:MAG TPA: DUF4129 domain-containing protein [Myxococcaceae bacterium]
MAAAVVASLVAAGSGAPPCDDVPAERAALERAATGTTHISFVAKVLEERCGAPLAAGLSMEAPAAEVVAALGARLEAFCARVKASGSPALRSGDREYLEEILARPEFGQARSADVDGLARLVAWLTAWFEALFESRGVQGFAQWTRVLVLALAIAVVLGVGFRLTSTWRGGGGRGRTKPAVQRRGMTLDAPEAHLSRGGAMLETDPRGAIREGLFALLGALERKALARADRVRTNRETAEEIVQRGATPEVSDQARQLLGWYDRTYYSLQSPAAPDARRFLDDVARLAARLVEGPV